MMTRPHLGYVRVSTDEQADSGYGLDVQRDGIIAYCNAMHYTLADIICDPGYSGASLNRPGIQQIITQVADCEFAGIIVYKLDRISRNLKDIMVLHDDVLSRCGTAIISVREQFDTSSATGRLFFSLLGSFAEFERSLITERTTAGKRQRAQQGKFSGGSAPLGYKLINSELVVDPAEAELVRKIFALRSEGRSMIAIANGLNADGIATKRGGIWTQATIKRILDRESVYKGRYRHGDIDVDGVHQPLLPESSEVL